MTTRVVFLDLILNALLCFTALFIIAYVQIRPEVEEEETPKIEFEGKYVVVMQWPDGSEDDVDLYVMDPSGNIAFFQNRDAGLMHLDHDDLGARSDTVRTAQGSYKVVKNEERVIIRGIVPGEYTVNVHMYSKRDPGETPVTIGLFRLRGVDAEVVSKQRVLPARGAEATAFRFTLKEDETVGNINELARQFVTPLLRRQGQRGGP
jgi:hypothetical protein